MEGREAQDRRTVKKRRKMTTEKAKEILKHKEEKLADIHKKILLLYQELKEMEHPDELMEAAALPSRSPVVVSGGGDTDNLSVLNRYYHQRRERGAEIRMQIWRLSEDAEDIRRLWGCFFSLQEPYYGILYNLYVKKVLYAAAESAFGYSHRMFEQRRKEGLSMLAGMFNSPYSSTELMDMGSEKFKEEKEGKKRAVQAM